MIIGNDQLIMHIKRNEIIINPINLDVINTLYDIICKQKSAIAVREDEYALMEKEKLETLAHKLPQLQGCSYDLSLDKFFINPLALNEDLIELSTSVLETNPDFKVIYPCNSIEQAYDKLLNIYERYLSKRNWIILQPKQRILASTSEIAGSNCLHINTSIASKSSWARWGLEVCSCAGWGDPGYANFWTLEIFNKNDSPVILHDGMTVAQIIFYRVEGCSVLYKGKYNNFGNIKKMFTSEERYQMMLPKPIKIKN